MKLHPIIAALVTEIDEFLERQKMTPTEFGRLSIGDPNLYRKLKHGRDLRLTTLDRIRSFMEHRNDHEGAAA